MRLGAIIAGGKSTRFGGDKGAALLNGKALIDHVADALRPQCDAIIICGREWPGIESHADQPARDMGPLGGLNAALHVAQQKGYDAVLTVGCDVLPVPLFEANEAGPAVIDDHYLFGVWPSSLADKLDTHLATQTNHSMRHWIATSDARLIESHLAFHNLNSRADFEQYASIQSVAA